MEWKGKTREREIERQGREGKQKKGGIKQVEMGAEASLFFFLLWRKEEDRKRRKGKGREEKERKGKERKGKEREASKVKGRRQVEMEVETYLRRLFSGK